METENEAIFWQQCSFSVVSLQTGISFIACDHLKNVLHDQLSLLKSLALPIIFSSTTETTIETDCSETSHFETYVTHLSQSGSRDKQYGPSLAGKMIE